MTLSHYTNCKLRFDNLYPVAQDEKPHFKPQGLWVSVDGPDDWYNWCIKERFGLSRLRYRYIVELIENIELLILVTEEDIREFTEKYSIAPISTLNWYHIIKWNEVADNYPGIIIPHYHWPLYNDDTVGWYYAWDCASGCIWDISIIKSIWFDTEMKVPDE